MQKTSHWAALYFVALMTFGNYVLFNLLVAILVEGFSSEVNSVTRSEITTVLPNFLFNYEIRGTSEGSGNSEKWLDWRQRKQESAATEILLRFPIHILCLTAILTPR